MSLRLVLALCLLVHTVCASSEHADHEVVAVAGLVAFLPCSSSVSDDVPSVEWSRPDLTPPIVLLYRDGCESHEAKNKWYEYRTSLVDAELKNGNVSLRLSGVLLSDAGTYHCKNMGNPQKHVITVVRLVVVASSEVSLSLVPPPDGGGGFAVRCDTGCWWPEPVVTLLDHDDRPIDKAHEERSPPNSGGGCRGKRLSVTLPGAIKTVKCRVHESKYNRTREALIHIPVVSADDCSDKNIFIGCFVLSFCINLILLGNLLRTRCCQSASKTSTRSQDLNDSLSSMDQNPEKQNLLNQKTESQNPENQNPENQNPENQIPENQNLVNPTTPSTDGLSDTTRVAPEHSFRAAQMEPERPRGSKGPPPADRQPDTLADLGPTPALAASGASSTSRSSSLNVQSRGGDPVPRPSGRMRPRINSSPASLPPVVPPEFRSTPFNVVGGHLRRSPSAGSADLSRAAETRQHRITLTLPAIPTYNRYNALSEEHE